MSNDLKLHEKLKGLTRYPFHMPGHKRNTDFGIAASEIDITEIDGFDNLHSPNGVLLDLEKRLSDIYKSKSSFLSVNGSTLGILAAVFSVCREGDKIIIARNAHKSVYDACLLRGLRVVFAEPEYDADDGYYGKIHQSEIDRAVKENGDAKAVVITSPTYEGLISNIKCDIPLIIDAAHGAHFVIEGYPEYPKGDIVISSLHKTLPALTQTAVINVYNEKYIGLVRRYISMLETSSPSYVLMNSASICCDVLESGYDKFVSLNKALGKLRNIKLSKLSLKQNDDISRIVISTNGTDISGSQLADFLRNEYLIEPELVSDSYIVLISTVGDTKEGLERLKTALFQIDERVQQCTKRKFLKPETIYGDVLVDYPAETEAIPLDEAVGRTVGEFVFAYPPDIPIAFPGMAVTEADLEQLKALGNSSICTVSESGLFPDKLLTKKA